MRKTLIVAVREFKAVVGTKAFLISVLAMPVFMFGGMFAMKLMENRGSIEVKKIAVIDHSNNFLGTMKMAASANNAMVDAPTSAPTESSEAQDSDGPPSFSAGTHYEILPIAPAQATDEKRLECCHQMRQQELAALVEIPADILEPSASSAIQIYSEDSGLSGMTNWIESTINARAKAMRFIELGLDAGEVESATQGLGFESLGLLRRAADGSLEPAAEKNVFRAILGPIVATMFMFMAIILACQPMLESVLEEKSQRIAEVLLGCANPTQIMAGKLLGSVAGSVLVMLVYMMGGIGFAKFNGQLDMFPLSIIPWFLLFQILGVLFYAAIYMAIGASVSQLKEAQSMAMPVMMLLMIPFFIWMPIVQEPNNSLAVWLTMFPPAAPGIIVLRMATETTIPIWQPICAALLLAFCAALVIHLAGRIFRIGILWQGKTPKIKELFRWALSG